MTDQALYRPNVGIILLNSEKKIFMGRRIDYRDNTDINVGWQMPQGGIDEGESPKEAALRELLEEVGTNKAIILKESEKWYHYDLSIDLQQKLWGGHFKGQRQKWFLMQFTGTQDDISLQTEHPEFCAMQWSHPEDILHLIVPFKKKHYEEVLSDFKEYFL